MGIGVEEIITAALDLVEGLAEGSDLSLPYPDLSGPPELTDAEAPGSRARGSPWRGPGPGDEDWYRRRVAIAARLSRLLDPAIPCQELVELAAERRDLIWGKTVSFSPKVFIDLSRLCRDRCAYCTFVRNPLSVSPRAAADGSPGSYIWSEAARSRPPYPYLLPEEVLGIAEKGQRAGCKEALFTLGDRPEDRYPAARRFLTQAGYDSTAHYLEDCARMVLEETGLLPHLNPGVMTAEELAAYRSVAPSCGMMLETTSYRLFADPGGCHHGSPDKDPSVRVATIEAAGALKIPFTTGILVGIGESLQARADTVVVLAALARRHGHIQEVIVQNFRAKPTVPMRNHPEPTMEEMIRVVALARLLMPDRVAVQAPPNLMPGEYPSLLRAGLSDWGGVSPVTLDHVNPEAAWPALSELRLACESGGFTLRPRLCVYPSFVLEDGWISDFVRPYVASAGDAGGWAKVEGALEAHLRGAPLRGAGLPDPEGAVETRSLSHG